jgi:hypothetical protein
MTESVIEKQRCVIARQALAVDVEFVLAAEGVPENV